MAVYISLVVRKSYEKTKTINALDHLSKLSYLSTMALSLISLKMGDRYIDCPFIKDEIIFLHSWILLFLAGITENREITFVWNYFHLGINSHLVL